MTLYHELYTVIWKLLTVSLTFSFLVQGQELVPGPEGDCGFSKFDARRIGHFAEKGALRKVTPQYPEATRAKGLGGTVRVHVLINKDGLVERTCPLYSPAEDTPDRSLVVAAEAAALRWRFKPNFGLEPVGNVTFDHAHDVLLFQFDPARPLTGDRQ